MRYLQKPLCEVVVLTTHGPEYQAVFSHLGKVQELVHPSGTIYSCGTFVGQHDTWHVAVVNIHPGSGTGAATLTQQAIEYFHPRIAFFVGTAGGLREGIMLGDVVVASKLYHYEPGKEYADGSFASRPESWQASHPLLQHALREANRECWQKRLGEAPPYPAPTVYIGALAAGSKLVVSKQAETVRLLRDHYEDTLAIEMEGQGFLQAVHVNASVEALVVRGIVNLLDDQSKAEEAFSQINAARHAAAFTFEVLWHQSIPKLQIVHAVNMFESSFPMAVSTRTNASLGNLERVNRGRMLNHLRQFYQELLDQSLQGITPIELDLSTQPDAVQNVRDQTFRKKSRTKQLSLRETSISQIYDDAQQELLILGEPGAGKSTLLLHLADHLTAQAERNENEPIPIVLPLASWATKQEMFEEWLIEQIVQIYRVPRNICREWLQQEQLLPLLDGLDEIKEEVRPACIIAINGYRDAHFGPLVVCSRTAEYKHVTVGQRLTLRNAIVVQPLTREQIDTAIKQEGGALESLQRQLQRQPEWRQLASTPLMLHVLIMTYQQTKVQTDPLTDTLLKK